MLYCMRCECIPVQRKRRIMSRVRCKNIKNDCPKPTCEDPVLLPQRCCKTC
ncbi:Dorsal-ventral patterning protein Sog, partial [Stegodyphus mimosarum]